VGVGEVFEHKMPATGRIAVRIEAVREQAGRRRRADIGVEGDLLAAAVPLGGAIGEIGLEDERGGRGWRGAIIAKAQPEELGQQGRERSVDGDRGHAAIAQDAGAPQHLCQAVSFGDLGKGNRHVAVTSVIDDTYCAPWPRAQANEGKVTR
jgi:hypothetical protein